MTDEPINPRDESERADEKRDEVSIPDERTSDGFGDFLVRLEGAKDEDEVFEILAGQRPPSNKLARQQLRGRLKPILEEKFVDLESGASAARTADAWLQEGGDMSDLQGEEFVIEDVEPWGCKVSGEDVLDETRELFSLYVHAPDEALNALALWTTYSYVYDLFGVCPLLDISSPTHRCGKSSTVVVIRYLCRAPLLSSNITPASLFRAVQAWHPCLLIDEADTFAKMSDEFRGILNAGHTRDTAFAIRAEGENNTPRVFSTWAPKVVAAIGRLPVTIEDRSIRVQLARKPTNVETRDAFDPDGPRTDCAATRRKLARWALDSLEAITLARPERIAGLNDRAWNNWKPLLAVAEAAGGEWPERAVAAAKVLSGFEEAEDFSNVDLSTLALAHVVEALEEAEDGRLGTGVLLAKLIDREDAPWAKFWESFLSRNETKQPASRLSRLLGPFGIKPRQLWLHGENVRGYDLADFPEALLAAYLSEGARNAGVARSGSNTGAGSSDPNDPSVLLGLLGDRALADRVVAAIHAGDVSLLTSDELKRLPAELRAKL